MNGMVYPLRHFSIPSDSIPDKTYDVVKWDNGRWTCECMAFVKGRHQKGRDIWSRIYCKHIDRAIEMDLEQPVREERAMPKEEVDGLNLSPELHALMDAI